MKYTTRRTALILASSIAALLAAPSAKAGTYYWDANGATAGVTDGAGAWLTASQWWTTDGANNTWTSGSDAVFGIGGAGGAVTLASPTTANTLAFNYFTGTYTLGTSGQGLTINNGITNNSGVGAVTINSAITLGAAQTWTNNSTGSISPSSGVNLNGNNLTLGGTGSFNFDSNTGGISGSGNIIKNGTGQLIFTTTLAPTYSWTGDIVLNGGYIGEQVSTVFSGRNMKITGGYIGGRFGSGFTWTGGLGTGANQIQITGGVSGFSGEGTSASTWQIGGALSTLTWGGASFNPSALILGGFDRMNANGLGALNNAIDLNGSDRIITSLQTNSDGATNTGFTVNGAITNGTGIAGLTKAGTGNIILNAANTYNGATNISGGWLTLSSATATINSTTSLGLSGGGILRLVNTSQVNRFADGAAITVSSGGGITYANTSGANTYTETVGAVTLNGGQFNLVESTDQVSTGSQKLTINTGGITRAGSTNTSAITFSALGAGVNATKNMFLVTGGGTSAANTIIGPWATVGTTAALQTDYAKYSSDFVVPAAISASAESTWSLATTGTSNYTANAGLGGSVGLTATRNINSLRSISPANTVTFTANSPTIALAGHTYANGDPVIFAAGTIPTGLTAGTTYFVVNAVAGTSFQVSATSGGTAITPTTAGATVTATGSLLVSSGNNLGTLGILNGVANTMTITGAGTGAVTLPTTTADVLHINTGSGGITINAPVNDNGAGVLSLAKNGSGTLILNGTNNVYTGDTAVNAGTLQVGVSGNVSQINSGAYAGNIFIGAGAQLRFTGNSSNTLSGIISGDGALDLARGTTTLTNSNTYTGKTTMTLVATNGVGSTINISSFNSVFTDAGLGTTHSASSSLGAPTTVANGTIDFGGGVQVTASINFTGASETTDRIINFVFNGTGARVIDNSGSVGSLLKFTSAFTSNGTASGAVTLQGSRDGELVQGLPFAFTTLNKAGAGTWTLDQQAGVTATISVTGGTLTLNGNQSNTTTTVSTAAGTLNLNGIVTGSAISASGSFFTNINQGSAGNIVGAASVALSSFGNITLAGINTYTGTTSVPGVDGSNASPAGNIIFQGLQALSPNTSFTVAHTGGTGSLAGFKLLDDSATPASRSSVNVTFTQSNASQNTFPIFVGNNSVANGGTSASTQTNSTIQLGNMNFSQGVVGATSGEGVVVSGANGYKLQVANVNVTLQAAFSANYNVLLQADNALLVTGSVQQASGAGAAATTTLQLAGTATGSQVSGIIKNSADGTPKVLNLSKSAGAGTWTLSNTNTYSGTTTVTTGTLASTNAVQGFGTNLSGISIGGAGTLSLVNDSTTSFTNGTSAYNIANSASGATINVDRATGTGSNTITVGNLTTTSTAASWGMTFTGANGVSLSAGNLNTPVSTTAATHTITNNVAGGGSLTLASVFDQATTVAAPALVFTGTANTIVSGAITQTLASMVLTKSGAGTLTLNGTNTYTGITTITSGVLEAFNLANGSSNSSIGASNNTAASLVFGAPTATLRYTGSANVTIDRGFTTSSTAGGGATIESSGSGTLSFDNTVAIAYQTNNQTRALTLGGTNTGANTFSKVIANNGTGATSLTKAGAGTWVLNQTNTYTGATLVSAGTLEVTLNNALGTNASGTSVTNGAALKLTGVNYSTAEALSINGTSISGGGALVNSGTSTFAGLITAVTSATINAGSGVLNLTGGLVKDGTTLTLTGGGSINISTVGISGPSAFSDLVVDGTTVTETVANTYVGATSILNGGTLNANVAGGLPTGTRTAVTFGSSGIATLSLGASQVVASLSSTTAATVTLGSNTLTVGAASGTTTFAGSIGGTSGNLTKDTAGSTQVLSGTNGYTGTTTVSGGTLAVTGSLSGTTAVIVNTGGTLVMNSAASNIVNTAATVTLAGGTLGFGNAANQTQTLGALTLTVNSTLDFGAGGGADKFLFAGFVHTPGTMLSINNWAGNSGGGTDGTDDRLVFTGSYTDFTSSFGQSEISFNGASGYAAIDFGGTSYEIVPVPEPATTALIGAVALCALIGYRERRRFCRKNGVNFTSR